MSDAFHARATPRAHTNASVEPGTFVPWRRSRTGSGMLGAARQSGSEGSAVKKKRPGIHLTYSLSLCSGALQAIGSIGRSSLDPLDRNEPAVASAVLGLGLGLLPEHICNRTRLRCKGGKT